MRLRIPILIGLNALALSGLQAEAQFLPADDFFHDGARAYLTNNIGGALQRVTNGLALYPRDEKLKKLEELLKQQQEQQQEQQQKQDQKNDSKQDQSKNQDQKSDRQKKSPDQQQSDKDKQQEQQKKDSQEQQDQKKDQQKQAKKSDEQKKQDKAADPQQGEATASGEMTPQEAKQLLNAQKSDELMMPVARKEKAANSQKTLKDW